MLATNLNYNSQERYLFEEVYINGKIELVKIDKEDYKNHTEHKQIIIEMSEGIYTSEQAQGLKAQLEEKLNATVKVIKHTADEQNKEEHYHFQILSNDEINNQSIYKVANDFIKAIKGAEMTQVRIYDNSKKNSFDLSEEARNELLKVKEDKFSFIKKDSKSHEIEEIKGYTKEGSKNATGLGKLDRPTYILNGVFNEKAKLISRFGIGMFKSDNIEITEETAKQAIKSFYMNIGQELGENWDNFLNLKIKESEEELSINFNNLIVLKNGNVASTAKNLIEEHLSKILKNAISNEQLIIENDDRLKPKEKVLSELQYLSGQEHKSEAEQTIAESVKIEEVKEQAKQSQATTDLYLDFMVEIKKIKTFEELEAKKAELEAEAEKVEAVKGILPAELINEKLEQIMDKQELLSIVKIERTREQELREELEKAKQDLVKQTLISKKLNNKLTTREAELQREKEAHQETKTKLYNKIKELENQVSNLQKTLLKEKEEHKDTKQLLKAESETAVKLRTNIKDLEADKDSLNQSLTAEQEAHAQTEKDLKAEILEQKELLKLEQKEHLKYSKLYNDLKIKLQKTEEELNTVNKKLADSNNKNKSLLSEIAEFTKEVLNLKNSNFNLLKQKEEIIKEKEILQNETKKLKEIVKNGKLYSEQQTKRIEELEEIVKNGKLYSEQQTKRIEELEAQKKEKGQGKGRQP